MALRKVKEEPESAESSSEDESLSSLKRKAESMVIRKRISEDSDDEPLVNNVLVTIEVQDVKEAQAFDFSMKSKPSTSKRKKIVKNKKKGRQFPCYICEAIFSTSQDLKTHSLEHQVKTRHKCEECGRYFKKAFSLRLHSKVHMEKSLKCPLCDLKFGFKVNLARHMMTHEKTVQCEMCSDKFHTKFQLKKHISSHPKRHYERTEEIKPCAIECKVEAISDHETEDAGTGIENDLKIDENGSEESNEHSYNYENKTEIYLRRQDLSYQTQCSIVNKLYKGRTVDEICKMYNLTPEVVNELWEDREKYMIHKKAGKKTLKYMNSLLDTRILEWFHNQKANNIQVSGKMLQDIAEAFAKESGFIAFNGSKKWLDRFKKRYNICFRGTPSKRDYQNVSVESKWKKIFFDEQWCDVRLGISDDDIYTGDEVGFYFNPSKGRIKKLAGRKFIQGYAKDRLAVFMCVNVLGTDRKKLLVCGTEDPLVHSYRDPDTLPVTYIRHSQAHFTTQMFEEYVKYWNRELQLQNRKAILVLDRAAIHSKLQLSHLKLVFVPWKAASGLMPMKNGISAAFRSEFRRLILEEKVMNVVRGVDRNMTCLEALYLLEKAWNRTPSDIITNSFVNTGYDVQPPQPNLYIVPKVTDNDEHMLCNMLKDYDVESYYTDLPNLDMFLTVDEELLTGQGTNGSVFGGNHRVTDPATQEREKEDILPLATEKPESNDKEMRIKKLRATRFGHSEKIFAVK
ncbi:tigger transposable element-derived protein 4-like [Manduca sexta]|uniref:tigger transposable element-derived protein 4-like n=1 Tax=Manduca sexta TaxID=7130 RepID=UPI00188E0ABF|nr:tigger transposable element-derived protein 4-like [Manduca sexta]